MTTAITLDRRMAAIYYSDVAGYSRLMGADEIGTISALRSAYSAIVEPAISDAGGRLVQIAGDAVLAEFSEPGDAVDCAVMIQRRLGERNVGIDPERRIEFRIGIPRRPVQSAPSAQPLFADEADRIADPVLSYLYRQSRRKAGA